MGSDLLKFMEPVSMQESGTFVFRTPKVWLQGRPAQLLDPRAQGGVVGYLQDCEGRGSRETPGTRTQPGACRALRCWRSPLCPLPPWGQSGAE